jgi:hypothetical protein
LQLSDNTYAFWHACICHFIQRTHHGQSLCSLTIVITLRQRTIEQLLYLVHRRFRYRLMVVICPFPPCIAPAQSLIRNSTIALCILTRQEPALSWRNERADFLATQFVMTSLRARKRRPQQLT